jgi:hypothetical protein
MHVGFTGTQQGMTAEQMQKVIELLIIHKPTHIHHGDCVGSDKQFHNICTRLDMGMMKIGHPPDNSWKRAFCDFDELWESKPYLVRNHDIVNESNIMYATPGEFEEVLRSGTWATIRYARSVERILFVVYPDGTT